MGIFFFQNVIISYNIVSCNYDIILFIKLIQYSEYLFSTVATNVLVL